MWLSQTHQTENPTVEYEDISVGLFAEKIWCSNMNIYVKTKQKRQFEWFLVVF